MDKVFSARMDPEIFERIANLARRLHKTKKQILAEAILEYENTAGRLLSLDILEHTFGAWKRSESVRKTVAKARKAFRDSMLRHGR
jgi:predicted DNA-binding protein